MLLFPKILPLPSSGYFNFASTLQNKTAPHMKIAPVLSKLGGPGVKKDIKKEPIEKHEEEKLHPEHRHSKMEEEIMSLSRSR